MLVELFKNKGSSAEINNYRDIFLGDDSGQAITQIVRHKLLPMAKGHFHKMLFERLQEPGNERHRVAVSQAETWADFQAVVDALDAGDDRDDDDTKEAPRDPARSWYRRHRAAKAKADERERRVAAERALQDAADDDDDGALGGLFGDDDDDA